jgi:hypothetical protein
LEFRIESLEPRGKYQSAEELTCTASSMWPVEL